MVRIYWLAVALGAGLALGLLIGGASESPEPSHADAPARVAQAPPATRPSGRLPDSRVAPAVPPAPSATPGAPASPQVALTFESIGEEVENGRPVLRRETAETLHAEFLREDRDDSWAYIREAELESEMFEEINSGRFRKERIECRASFCEIHLTAKGEEQAAALKKWYEKRNELLREPRPNSPLQMRLSSYTNQSEQGVAEVRFTYQKPAQFMAAPGGN